MTGDAVTEVPVRQASVPVRAPVRPVAEAQHPTQPQTGENPAETRNPPSGEAGKQSEQVTDAERAEREAEITRAGEIVNADPPTLENKLAVAAGEAEDIEEAQEEVVTDGQEYAQAAREIDELVPIIDSLAQKTELPRDKVDAAKAIFKSEIFGINPAGVWRWWNLGKSVPVMRELAENTLAARNARDVANAWGVIGSHATGEVTAESLQTSIATDTSEAGKTILTNKTKLLVTGKRLEALELRKEHLSMEELDAMDEDRETVRILSAELPILEDRFKFGTIALDIMKADGDDFRQFIASEDARQGIVDRYGTEADTAEENVDTAEAKLTRKLKSTTKAAFGAAAKGQISKESAQLFEELPKMIREHPALLAQATEMVHAGEKEGKKSTLKEILMALFLLLTGGIVDQLQDMGESQAA